MDAEERLAAYAALVRSWAPRLNLVSVEDLERLEQRHIDDSLRAAPILEECPDGPCVDVGSGAGLPGIPLAIASPGRRWRLIEPRKKRVAFLEEVIRRLGLGNVTVHQITAAQAERTWAGAHAFATARALAEPARAAEMLLPLVGPGGLVAVFLGEHSRLPPGAEEWQKGLAIVRVR